jgi:hypothetical protein
MAACSARAVPPTITQSDTRPAPPPSSPAPGTTDSPISATPTPAPIDLDKDCALTAAAGEPIATLAVSEVINPANAPRPSNNSEQLLFRQLYETLLRVDCMGRMRAGLAASWRFDADERHWLVTLRDGARFADGTVVTSADVLASWSDARGLRADVSRLVHAIAAVDDRSLAISLQQGGNTEPRSLAIADLAIVKPAAGSPWPLGTRGARVTTDAGPAVITVARDGAATLTIVAAAADPRDLLDRQADLLITRDPATLDYARTLSQFELISLPWQRVHLLLSPGRARSSPMLSDQARQVLADDAVRGEARGAKGPLWWLAGCGVAASTLPTRAATVPRVVFASGDPVARDLAERFVGLARGSGPGLTPFLDALLPDRPRRSFQGTAGLAGDELARAQRLGADAGYVVSMDSWPLEPCRDLQALMDRAPWLDPATIVPLVETRQHAIVRRGRSGVFIEFDGGMILAGGTAARQP